MNPQQLERVRQKVEAGEELSAEEMELLRRAAQALGTPALRLTVAHALVNASEHRQAVSMLETLQRDYPRDLQVRLGLARALVAQERYVEAERPLHEALRLNPGDPEALKALAVCALRRGEFERARRWVDDVLRVDPFDGEAQLLKGELAQCEVSAGVRPLGREQFARALMERLDRAGTLHRREGDQLVVKLGRGGVARLDLRSLHEEFVRGERSLEETVGAIARELAESALGVPEEARAVLERVLPVVREESFLEQAKGALHREGPAGLWFFYVLDDPELVRYLPEGALAPLQLTLEALDAAAWSNLAARPAQVHPVTVEAAPQGAALWALAEGDGYDAARLLDPAQHVRLKEAAGDGPYRVFLGMREVVLLCPETDLEAVRHLEAARPSEDGVRGRFRLVLHASGATLERVELTPPVASA